MPTPPLQSDSKFDKPDRKHDIGLGRTAVPKQGVLHTTIRGYSGKEKIIKYNFQKLINLGPFLTLFWRGTVFNLDRTLLFNMLKYVAVFFFCMLSLIFNDDIEDFKSNAMPSFESATSNLQKFCPFLFGLFVSTILARWWSLRSQGVGAVADHICNISCFMTAAASRRLVSAEDWGLFEEQHAKVVRYGLASLSCLAKESRGPHAPLDELVEIGLLDEGEKVLIEKCPPHSRAEALWCWMTCISTETMEMVKMPPPNMNIMFNDLNSGMDGVHTVHQYLGTQLPFPYVHMITFLVDIHNIVVAMLSGLKFAIAFREQRATGCVIEVFQLILVPTMYQGLLQICMFLSDPMGDDIIDFPILEYQMAVKDSCLAMLRTTRTMCESRWADSRSPLPNATIVNKLPAPPAIAQEPQAASPEKQAPLPGPDHEKAGAAAAPSLGHDQMLSLVPMTGAQQEMQLALAAKHTGSMKAARAPANAMHFFEQLSGWLKEVQRNIARIPPMPRVQNTEQKKQLELTMTTSVVNGSRSNGQPMEVQAQSQHQAPGVFMPCCTVSKGNAYKQLR
eukprot:TRINITY_DN32588_c0_g1_i1.p1 TRINITY_DN32588_c0_g1~~TRINITY_DN32588_c0_g1_i1.p1  ORF type:complete len:562 (-),score=99.74 TRINITY_DN32588_c0_g1_i1:212-1897(-)